MEDLGLRLSTEQEQALVDGCVSVISGPGSGKTRVLTARVISWAAHEDQVLALTFTNKAADEMRFRIANEISEAPEVRTFHAYAARHLRKRYPRLTILNQRDSQSIWNSFCKEKAEQKSISVYDYVGNFPPEIQDEIVASRCQWFGLSPDRYREIEEQYLEELNRMASYDFQMLIQRFVELQREGQTPTYKKLAVDEFQDTSYIQYEMMKRLTESDTDIFVVGDPDQMLYHWRGANADNFRMFETEFSPKIVYLEDNYRSTTSICNCCNRIIANNVNRYEKQTNAVRQMQGTTSIAKFASDSDEARWIARSIADDIFNCGREPREIAVLARTNVILSSLLETSLRANKIPYEILSGPSFFGRREIDALIGILKFVQNDRHSIGLIKFCKFFSMGIGERTVTKLYQSVKINDQLLPDAFVEKYEDVKRSKWKDNAYNLFQALIKYRECCPQEMLASIIDDLDLKQIIEDMDEKEETDRMANVNQLMEILLDYDTLEEALEYLSLASDQDTDSEKNKVKLMTIHASKGLEFDIVYVLGLEEGTLPNSRTLVEDSDDESERRVFFVACSRARDVLRLTTCGSRRHVKEQLMPSRFIAETSCHT